MIEPLGIPDKLGIGKYGLLRSVLHLTGAALVPVSVALMRLGSKAMGKSKIEVFVRRDRDEHYAGTEELVRKARAEVCVLSHSLEKMLTSTSPEFRELIDKRIGEGVRFRF